ncbi:MAG: beta strand repeat-containing protein [Acidimicrobiales bacterium]
MTTPAVTSERGDTLIEVLLALIVLSLAALALMLGFSESISASARHRELATSSVVLDRVSQDVVSQVQQSPALFRACNSAAYYNTPASSGINLPVVAGYTEQITAVGFWTGSAFQPSSYFTNPPACPETSSSNAPEQITVTVTNTATQRTYQMSFVVVYPLSGANAVVNSNPATQLVFTTFAAGGTVGVPFSTQPVVSVEDQYGNAVTTDLSPVVISAFQGSTPVTVTGCTESEFNGTITFSGCSIATPGTYTIVASEAGVTVASSTITVAAASYHLVFATQPVGGASGAAFATAPVVQIQNSQGQVATSWTGTVTIISSGGQLSGCSNLTVTSGVVNASTCTFAGGFFYNPINGNTLATPYTLSASATSSIPTSPGTSQTFTVSGPGTATKLAFSTQPTGVASGSPSDPFTQQPQVTVEDSFGNVVTSGYNTNVSLTMSAGTLTCSSNAVAPSSGVAAFSGCHGGAYANGLTLTASSGTLTSATSASFNITPAASKLVITTQPVAGASGASFATQPVIKFEDSAGDVVTSASATVTLTPSGGTLSFCSSLSPVNGVVTVTGCTFAGVVGTSYTLTASAPGVTSAVSAAFSPTTFGTPTQLLFGTQPSAGAAGSPLVTQPVIKIEDSGGNVTNSTAVIALTSSAGGTLTNCTSLGGVSGVVTVSNCSFGGLVNTNYTLTATSGGLASATSASFQVTGPGPVQQILLTGCSSNIVWPATCSVTATLEDQFTNVETADNSSSVVFLQGSGTGGATATSPVTATAGVALSTFASTAVGTVTAEAQSNSLTSNLVTFTVLPAPQSVSFYTSNSYLTTTTSSSATFTSSLTYQTYAKGSHNGPITFGSNTPSLCSISSSGLITVLGAGSCVVTSDAAAIGNYADSGTTTFTLTVAKGSQTNSFTSTAPAGATVGGATYTPTATATSGLVVAITVDASSSSVCSIAGGVVSFQAVGTCTLDANQAGNANWNAAPQVQQSFAVGGSYSGSSSGNLPNGSPGLYFGINTTNSVGSGTSTANALTPGVAEHLTSFTFTINTSSGTNHVATVGIITAGVWTATALTCTITGGLGQTSCTISASVSVPVGSSINVRAYGNGSHSGSWVTTYTQP